MTPEHERAIAQAERNAAEAAYFDSDEHKYGPRPNQRPTFRAGFNAGWDRRDAVGVNRSAEIARLTAEIDRLQRTIDSRPVVNAGNGLDKLLPCPFCGGRAEMDTMTPFTSIFTGMSETGISAYCTDCSAEIMVCRPDVPDVTEEMVAEMWNTRAPRTCLACCRDVKNIHKYPAEYADY